MYENKSGEGTCGEKRMSVARKVGLSREKARKELIESHVRVIERGSLVSLRFQERLIENVGLLEEDLRVKIISFLRPCDMEEISIERSERGCCGWLECLRRIPESSFCGLGSKWSLDSSRGEIIERSTLSLFCSSKCYYKYLSISASLLESPPHLRVEALDEIQRFLDSNQRDNENTDTNTNTSESNSKRSEEKDAIKKLDVDGNCNDREESFVETVSSSLDQKDRVLEVLELGLDSVSLREDDNLKEKGGERGLLEDDGTLLGDSQYLEIKERGLCEILKDISNYKNKNLGYRKDQIIKKFDYLSIGELENDVKIEKDSRNTQQDYDSDSKGLIQSEFKVGGKESEKSSTDEDCDQYEHEKEVMQQEGYTYSSMMQVLEDLSDESQDSEIGDEYQSFEDNILLMSQFYDQLSPEVVVLDMLTSLISEETRNLLALIPNSEKKQNNKLPDNDEFNRLQNERRNVLKDMISGYMNSIEWISQYKVIIFSIYKLLDTFIFPFSIPNLKTSTLELLVLILLQIALDNKTKFGLEISMNSPQDQTIKVINEWMNIIGGKYDSKFINNIKLLFVSE